MIYIYSGSCFLKILGESILTGFHPFWCHVKSWQLKLLHYCMDWILYWLKSLHKIKSTSGFEAPDTFSSGCHTDYYDFDKSRQIGGGIIGVADYAITPKNIANYVITPCKKICPKNAKKCQNAKK